MEKKDWIKRLWSRFEILLTIIDGNCRTTYPPHNEEGKKILEDFISQELDKARREGEMGVLTEIFQTCYQEDSKTLELVEEKLSKLKDNK